MPVSILINGVAGSDESAVSFDGASSITLTSPTTATYLWTFLDWPVGSTIDQDWLVLFGDTAPAIVWTPDVAGTWRVQLTDTTDSTTETLIVGVRSTRSSIRIPAAGETTETSNIAVGLSTNDRGWALSRNTDIDTFDKLLTSGAVQLCFLDDAVNVGAGTVDAGVVVSISGSSVVDPTTGETIPTVVLTTAAVGAPTAYAGIIAAGRVTQAANPGPNQFKFQTTNIPDQSYVWVRRSGVVEGGAAGTLDLSAFAVGDFVYASGVTPGGVHRNIDRFNDPASPEVMIPVGLCYHAANPGAALVLPSLPGYAGHPGAGTWRWTGMMDTSGIRLGVPVPSSVSGESPGTIELLAQNNDSIVLTQGMLCCVTGNTVYKADSSDSKSVASTRQHGIFCIAVEDVAIGSTGHFTVFGECPNAVLNGAPDPGNIFYVGSSTTPNGDLSGIGVLLEEIQYVPTTDDEEYSKAIPIGVYTDNGVLLMGSIQDEGIVGNIGSTLSKSSYGKKVANSKSLNIQRTNIHQDEKSKEAVIDITGTLADEQTYPITVYEQVIPATELYGVEDGAMAAAILPAPLDTTGVPLANALWDPLAPAGNSTVFGSFVFDHRLFNETTTDQIKLTVSGYYHDIVLGSINLIPKIRFVDYKKDSPSTSADYNIYTELLTANYFVSGASGNVIPITIQLPLIDTATLLYLGVLSGHPLYNEGFNDAPSGLDIVIERDAGEAIPFVLTSIKLEALSSKKNLFNTTTPLIPSITGGGITSFFESKHNGTPQVDKAVGFRFSDTSLLMLGSSITVGANLSGATSGTYCGFVAFDGRSIGSELNSHILVRYSGGSGVGAPSETITLQLTVKALYSDTEENTAIGVGDWQSTVSIIPTGSAADAFQALDFVFTIPTATFPLSDPIGILYEITRVGTNPLTLDGGERWCHLAAISFVGEPSNYNDEQLTDVYEEKIQPTVLLDAVTGNLNLDFIGDYSGVRVRPGNPVVFPVVWDKRYNRRLPLKVQVHGVVIAAGAEIKLQLSYTSHNSPSFGEVLPVLADYEVLEERSFDISSYVGPATVLVTTHEFLLPADFLWQEGNAQLTIGNNTESVFTYLGVTRTDADPGVFTIIGITIQTDIGKYETKEEPYIKIAGAQATKNATVYVPGARRGTITGDLVTSQYRFTWNYAVSDLNILNAASQCVYPAGYLSSDLLVAAGVLIPYNIAVLGVYGWVLDKKNPLPAQDIVLDILSPAFVPVAIGAISPTIFNFPLTITSGADGSIHWVPSTQAIPKVFLPADYAAQDKWLLGILYTNTTGSDVDLNAYISIEVAILPTEEGVG